MDIGVGSRIKSLYQRKLLIKFDSEINIQIMKYQPQEQDKLKQRLLLIDAVRGVAIIGVVVFHIVWDLEFVGFIIGVASHPIWLAFGRTLAGTFMFLVGVSLILAHSHSFKASSFARRLLVLLLAASTITAATWYAFPDTFIYFSVIFV